MSLESHRRDAPERLRFAVLTFSDTRDAASDRGGAYLVERLEEAGHEVVLRAIHADETEEIRAAVRAAEAEPSCDLVLTTGGTGIAPRDRTFDALRGVLDSEIPGFGAYGTPCWAATPPRGRQRLAHSAREAGVASIFRRRSRERRAVSEGPWRPSRGRAAVALRSASWLAGRAGCGCAGKGEAAVARNSHLPGLSNWKAARNVLCSRRGPTGGTARRTPRAPLRMGVRWRAGARRAWRQQLRWTPMTLTVSSLGRAGCFVPAPRGPT